MTTANSTSWSVRRSANGISISSLQPISELLAFRKRPNLSNSVNVFPWLICVSALASAMVLVIDRRADDLARIRDRGAERHPAQRHADAGLGHLFHGGAHIREVLDHPVGARVRPGGLRNGRKRFRDVDDFLADGDTDPVFVEEAEFHRGVSSMASSSSAAEFAQQPELLVHRTIRITEDDGVLARSDGPLAPAGNDDDV